jgi:hypothetical protein
LDVSSAVTVVGELLFLDEVKLDKRLGVAKAGTTGCNACRKAIGCCTGDGDKEGG